MDPVAAALSRVLRGAEHALLWGGVVLIAIAEEEPEVDPLIGATIGERFLIERRIARGGMGTVYRAVHTELGRSVAVKVLASAYADDDEAVRRFQREAKAATKIAHSNIVQILDLGQLDSGEPYLVMELLEGEDLADHISRAGAMTPLAALEILRPVASALDAVHAKKLLHRDVKPANIFLAAEADGTVTPKLLDFGLAALRDTPEHDRLTREGIVVGTPHYVSPEAAEGEEVDERSDVYSLGLVAFEMLTGVLPIDGEGSISLLYEKVRRPAPTMSQRTGRAFPPELEQLIARTLSRTPAKRPASAGELVERFASVVRALPREGVQRELPKLETAPNEIVKDEKKKQSPPPTHIDLPLAKDERLLIGAAVALVLLAAGIGGWYALPSSPEETSPRPRAQAQAESSTPAPVTHASTAMPEVPPENAMVPIAPQPPRVAPRATKRVVTAPEPQIAAAPPETITLPRDEGRSEALTREGGSELLRGHVPRARQLYRQAAFADPENARAWRGLGLASERMGLAPEASHAYREYLRLAPASSDAALVRQRLERMEREALQ